MKIYAPVKDANGIYASVRFVDGVGETDNPKLIEWFRKHGYKVPIAQNSEKIVKNSEPVETTEKSEKIPTMTSGYVSVGAVETPESVTTVASTEPDFDAMTPIELREWARANGLGSKIKNTRNKEKLLEIIRG